MTVPKKTEFTLAEPRKLSTRVKGCGDRLGNEERRKRRGTGQGEGGREGGVPSIAGPKLL